MNQYIRFLKGTPAAYKKLSVKDSDTLYFICEEDETIGSLYLGSKLIAGPDIGDMNISIDKFLFLSKLKDVLIQEGFEHQYFLVYDTNVAAWVNKSLNELLFTGGEKGMPGLVPSPGKQVDLFLKGDGTWANPMVNHTILTIQNHNQLSHVDIIAEQNLSFIAGDIIIIKDIVYKYEQQIPYIYDGNKWHSLYNTYQNASNVYFDKDFITNYNIGNIKEDEVIAAAGKTIPEVFDMIFGGEKIIEEKPIVAKPIDEDSYFTNYTEARLAALKANKINTIGKKYYYGQMLTVVDDMDTKLYVVKPNNTLQQIAQINDIPAPIDTYTKKEIDSKVAAAAHLKRKMVDSVEFISAYMESNEDAEQYIYMVPTGFELADNRYDEYMIIPIIDEDGVEIRIIERVGTWEINLNDYSKKEDILLLSSRISDLEKRFAVLENSIQGQT